MDIFGSRKKNSSGHNVFERHVLVLKSSGQHQVPLWECIEEKKEKDATIWCDLLIWTGMTSQRENRYKYNPFSEPETEPREGPESSLESLLVLPPPRNRQ